MKRLLTEIASIIGEPEPYAIKRKFLINYPDTALLDTLPNCSKVDIMQTYLLPEQPHAGAHPPAWRQWPLYLL